MILITVFSKSVEVLNLLTSSVLNLDSFPLIPNFSAYNPTEYTFALIGPMVLTRTPHPNRVKAFVPNLSMYSINKLSAGIR